MANPPTESEELWLGPWKLTGSFPARKLTRYKTGAGFEEAVEYIFEDDGHGNQTEKFLAQLVELKNNYPTYMVNVKMTEPARPKITKTEDRAVITSRPASVSGELKDFVDAVIGPIDTEFDAQVIASILNEHHHKGFSDWEAVKTRTEVTETVL